MLVRFFSAIILMLLTIGCGEISNNSLKSSSQIKNKKPSYLYVIMSNHGSIAKNDQGEFVLKLDHSDVEKVLAFSDRPFRIVKHMTGDEFKQNWTEGDNSFAKDPPNATVIINQHLQTIILTSVNMTEETMTFTIKQDGPQPIVPMEGTTQVFIDGLSPV